jgi:malate synthase
MTETRRSETTASSVAAAAHPSTAQLGAEAILTPDALAFVADLERNFGARRRALLAARHERQSRIDAGERPGFLAETASVRNGDWQVAAPPKDLLDRRTEITGPVERKMMINALNCGAKVFMADFEDSNSPTWDNVVIGQINVRDAVRRTISLDQNGKHYRLDDEIATLVIRPRGWHLTEKHVLVDGQRMSASLFDFGMVMFHNARVALDAGTGPYFYLPKLEGHLEARLWNDVFCHAQDALAIDRGSVKATVLIETILAAFEMDEILYELREHSAGLNAGRWDYIFSVAKKFARDPKFVLPDRADVTMTVPFMRAYTELMVKTCHKRGAHAIGGMSAFIPNRRDPEVTEQALRKVTDDKRREATDGCDGTWVAHPDLVPVAMAEFDRVLGSRPNQVDRQRPDVHVVAADLLSVDKTGGSVTEAGVRMNVDVGLRYLESWLSGTGAAAIHNLMEDAATAEISRAQLWQWVRNSVPMANGEIVTSSMVQRVIDEELSDRRDELGDDAYLASRYVEARQIFEQVALAEDFVEFLTLPAYELLP